MSNKDKQILTLWAQLSEREKKEVLSQIQARVKRERGQKQVFGSAAERQTRQLRPVWRFALDVVNALGSVALFYLLTVAMLLLA